MKTCIKCGSHAFNLYAEEIDQGGLCDVHYWQGRAHRAEALAQPEQEPVAWEQFYPDIGKPQLKQEPVGFMNAGHVHEMQQGRLPYGYVYPKGGVGADIAVYTTPPKRQPLTDEQIKQIRFDTITELVTMEESELRFARAIEAATA